MPKKNVVSDELPTPAGPYSHIVEVNGIVFTAGFGPQDPATGAFGSTVAEQTAGVLRNLSTALGLAGLTLAEVVKTTVHLAGLADREPAPHEQAPPQHGLRRYETDEPKHTLLDRTLSAERTRRSGCVGCCRAINPWHRTALRERRRTTPRRSSPAYSGGYRCH